MTSAPAGPGGKERFGPRPVGTVVLGWLAMIGVDFFLHAGLLAPLYDWDSPFLLRPDEAFARIPIGYLGFLVRPRLYEPGIRPITHTVCRLRLDRAPAGP